MPQTVQCPACSARLSVPDHLANAPVKCPKCQKTFTASAAQPTPSQAVQRTPAAPPPAPPPAYSAGNDFSTLQDGPPTLPEELPGQGLALATAALVGACILTDLLALWGGIQQNALLDRAKQGIQITDREADANDLFVGGVGLLQTGAFLASAIVWCFWVHRMAKNVRLFGMAGMEYSPGWAIGWYFIPIMNLFRPYQAMAEIWRASDPRALEAYSWRRASGSALLGSWWAAWLISNIINNVAMRSAFRPNPSLDDLKFLTNMNLIADAGSSVAAVLAILVVLGLKNRQLEKFDRLTQGGGESVQG